MKTAVKIVSAIIAAMGVACIGIALDWSGSIIFGSYLFVGITMCLVLGVFNMPKNDKGHMSIKNDDRYNKAA